MSSSAKQMDLSRTNPLIRGLLTDNELFEPAFLEWLSRILKASQIPSFIHLADYNIHFLQLTKITNLYNAIPLSPFLNEPSLANYVTHLLEIWRDFRSINIYTIFEPHLHNIFNPSFVFEDDFESLIYSYPRQVFGVILVVTMMTVLLVNQDEDEDKLRIFHDLGDLALPHKEFLQTALKDIIRLYEEVISSAEQPTFGLTSINNIGTGVESRRRISTVNDIQLFKKVDEQQMTIDTLQRENEDLKTRVYELQKELGSLGQTAADRERTIQQLSFSKDDLVSKLRTQTLSFQTESLKDKETEIERLRTALAQKEQHFRGSIRELEDDRENLHKRIHQLENYRVEFENHSRRTINKSFDDRELGEHGRGRVVQELAELKVKYN